LHNQHKSPNKWQFIAQHRTYLYPSPIAQRSLTEERYLANQSAGDHRLSSLADDKQKHNWDRAVKNRAAWQSSPALS